MSHVNYIFFKKSKFSASCKFIAYLNPASPRVNSMNLTRKKNISGVQCYTFHQCHNRDQPAALPMADLCGPAHRAKDRDCLCVQHLLPVALANHPQG